MTFSMAGLDLSGIKWKPIVEKERARKPARRSHLSCPMIILDTMEYTMNHTDGKRYGSKRAYQKAVRAADCEIVGNEKLPDKIPFKSEGVREDIHRAIAETS